MQRTRFGSTLTWEDLWENPEIKEVFHSSFAPISQYLWLSRNTESPKQYHLWCLLSLTSALASNCVWLNNGVGGRVKLNFGIVLSGRPALKKSSAINFMLRFANGFPLNYGPTDTAGARHGIMSAMQSRWQDDIKDSVDEVTSLEQLAASNFDSIIAKLDRSRMRPSSIYFPSKELGRLLTAQTRELLDFFVDGLDGEAIFYQTKAGNIRIPSPLINLLGATTPGSLPHILPRDSHDHGMLSRLIFVYGSKPEKAVPIPPEFTEQELNIQVQLYDQLKRISNEADGEITFSDKALELFKSLYSYAIPTLEFRLNAYSGRRAIHLEKLAALICLLRGESPYVISPEDVALAHIILILTEIQMDGAYIGLDKSPDAKVYSLLREIMESSPDGMIEDIVAATHVQRSGILRDHDEAIGCLTRLRSAGKIEQVGDQYRIAPSVGGDNARLFLDSFKRNYAKAS